MHRPLTAACAVALGVLTLGAGTAGASIYAGTTTQDLGAGLSTSAKGVPEAFVAKWIATCSNDMFPEQSTKTAVTGATAKSFEMSSTDQMRQKGVVLSYADKINGTYDAGADIWKGTFQATLTFTKKGKKLDVCKTGKVNWTAGLADTAGAGR